jgi:hypothetical protein
MNRYKTKIYLTGTLFMAFLIGFMAFGVAFALVPSMASAVFGIGLLIGGAFGYHSSGIVWEREQCKIKNSH